jgi:hypothetical protein
MTSIGGGFAAPRIRSVEIGGLVTISGRSPTSAKVQIDYRRCYAHTRTRAVHSKLPVDPCAKRCL